MVKSLGQMNCLYSAFVVMILAIAGCSQTPPANEVTYPVHGTATLDGEPLKGGKIIFNRVDLPSLSGQAKINAEGEYHAFCYARQDGLTPGEYKLTLEQYAGEPKQPIPEKYKSAEKSDKKVTVTEGDNSLDVDFVAGEGDEGDGGGAAMDADADADAE